MKNINQVDADLFVRFSQYAIKSGNLVFVINPDNGKYLKENLGISFKEYLRLRELGLLFPNDLSHIIGKSDADESHVFTCGKTCVVIERPAGSPEKSARAILFTEVGKELLNLVEAKQADVPYLMKLVEPLRSENVMVKYGLILEDLGDSIKHAELHELPSEMKTV